MMKSRYPQWIMPVIYLMLLSSCSSFPWTTPVDQEELPSTPTSVITSTPTPWEPTPTRTRPVRSFFIRPTLAETPTVVEFTYPQPGEEEAQIPITSTLVITSTSTLVPVNISTPSATPLPTTTRIAPTPSRAIITEPRLLDFVMFDANNGWGLTENLILRTSQGGTQWVDVSPMGFETQLQLIPYGFFPDPNHAWVLIIGSNDTIGTLYRSETGGNSWESDPVDFTNARFTFVPGNSNNYSNGWALAERSTTNNAQAVDLYATSDGGETWSLIHQATPVLGNQGGNLPYTGFKNGITFRNSLRGWITGESPQSGESWLYVTNDGGRSWYEQVLFLPTGSQTNTVITNPPFFFNDQQGLLPVRLEQISELTVLYETTDGGTNWAFTTPVPVVGPIDCVSPTTCRIWNGRILASTENGGVSWRQTTTNIDLSDLFYKFDFIDSLVGFAISTENIGGTSSSSFYLTVDGGYTWTTIW